MNAQSTLKTIRVNGVIKTTTSTTVADLLRELQAPQIGVAVARNGVIVRRAEQQSTLIADGDDIEIIRAVQGG